MNRVGFADRSLREMENLWQGIELFHFVVPSPHEYSPSDRAWCWLKIADISSLHEILRKALSDMIENEKENSFKIGPFNVGVRRWGDNAAILIDLTEFRPWQPSDFDKLREIDLRLRILKLPSMPKPHGVVSFFRGKVLENNEE